jgi:hypothetical protein
VAIALAAAMTATLPAPASAQGLFDFLFGNVRRAAPPATAHSYADPNDPQSDANAPAPRDYGPAVAYCVRTCDGHFFPIQRHAGATAVELCKSFCPAATTKIYSGSGIANAVSSDGKRYSDLPNAFAYRDRIVSDCTCNGSNPFGLAKVGAKSDPTLQQGDIVATNDGLMSYRGTRKGRAEFSPVSRGELGKTLSAMRVQRAGEPVGVD